MTKLPFMQFYPNDWLRDTRKLTAAAKAVWIDVISMCWNEPERGVYKRTKRAMCHEHYLDPQELEDILSELQTVGDVIDNGDNVLIVSRRIQKHEYAREYERNKKRKQRCPQDVPKVSPENNGHVPPKTLDVRRQTSEVINGKTPLTPPQGGENVSKPKREKREGKRVEFWQAIVDHVNKSWVSRKGVPYPWDPHEFKKLHALSVVYQAWGMMAMWDLYVQMGTYWGKLSGLMLDGLKKDVGVIVDDPRWKSLCQSYEDRLFAPSADDVMPTKGILKDLVASAKQIP